MLTSGAVLTGGRSHRMGTDKALLMLGSGTMVEHMVETLEAAVDVVRLVGGAIEHPRAATVEDRYPDEGPLGGVISALHGSDADVTVLVGCDLPRLTPAVVSTLIETVSTTGADYAVPIIGGRRQWHCVAWDTRCVGQLGDMFDSGVRSFLPAVEGMQESAVLLAESHIFDDLDTPEDYEQYLSSQTEAGRRAHR